MRLCALIHTNLEASTALQTPIKPAVISRLLIQDHINLTSCFLPNSTFVCCPTLPWKKQISGKKTSCFGCGRVGMVGSPVLRSVLHRPGSAGAETGDHKHLLLYTNMDNLNPRIIRIFQSPISHVLLCPLNSKEKQP